MKAYIPNRNLLTWLRSTVEWLQRHNIEPVVLDNASDYLPLLDWYSKHPCEVVRLPRNMGSMSFWSSGLCQKVKERFYLTDPDLDYTGIPGDFVGKMEQALESYPHILKVGFSIETNDIPEMNCNREWAGGKSITEWEKRHWRAKEGNVWLAEVDTTFAMYRSAESFSYVGLRLDRPYTVRHRPWYLDYAHIDAEYSYYLAHADPVISNSVRFSKVGTK